MIRHCRLKLLSRSFITWLMSFFGKPVEQEIFWEKRFYLEHIPPDAGSETFNKGRGSLRYATFAVSANRALDLVLLPCECVSDSWNADHGIHSICRCNTILSWWDAMLFTIVACYVQKCIEQFHVWVVHKVEKLSPSAWLMLCQILVICMLQYTREIEIGIFVP